LTSNDMLCALLMRSANDGCVAAAEYVAGSEAAFVDKMNRKAVQLGATNTHFMNPHGLQNPQHFTSARDLALIARAAMQEERIRDVVRMEKCKIVRSMNTRDVTMRNHSHFLGHYEGADGIKTGWTIPAGHCYVGSATRNGWQLISVVLKSPNYVHETAEMMNFGFTNFEPHEVARAGEVAGQCLVQNGARPTVTVAIPRAMQFVSRRGESAAFSRHITLPPTVAPVVEGSSIGSMEVLDVGGRQVASTPLIATSGVPLARPIALAQGNFAGRFTALIGILAAVLVSLRYGTRQKTRFTTFTKGPRRRRRRLAPSLRDDDYGG
jgi:D-alanyl-D-alanine carboxypeptidase (penicillin-binding protein 5/6)